MIETKIKLLNIESDFLTSKEALSKVLTELETLSIGKITKVLEVVHGYGSSGKGGVIKKQLQILLPTLVKQNKILDFIAGEKFSPQNSKYKNYTKLYPELILDSNLRNLNPGITIIFLK